MNKKILVVVDMQNDFISGSLGTKEAQTVVKSIKKKVDKAVKEKTEVVYTRDTHGANCRFVKHMLHRAQIIPKHFIRCFPVKRSHRKVVVISTVIDF